MKSPTPLAGGASSCLLKLPVSAEAPAGLASRGTYSGAGRPAFLWAPQSGRVGRASEDPGALIGFLSHRTWSPCSGFRRCALGVPMLSAPARHSCSASPRSGTLSLRQRHHITLPPGAPTRHPQATTCSQRPLGGHQPPPTPASRHFSNTPALGGSCLSPFLVTGLEQSVLSGALGRALSLRLAIARVRQSPPPAQGTRGRRLPQAGLASPPAHTRPGRTEGRGRHRLHLRPGLGKLL